jgi:hypothetical protein
MKATIEIPDELYRQVKAKSALEDRTIREVTIELYQTWLSRSPAAGAVPTPEDWLSEWFRLADEMMKDAPPGPTARAILEEGRSRLERS